MYAIREIIKGKGEELEIHLRRAQQKYLKVEINLNFAHDTTLLSEKVDFAQELLLMVKKKTVKGEP